MKATEFVRKFGIDNASDVINRSPQAATYFRFDGCTGGLVVYGRGEYRGKSTRVLSIEELKCLVESHELADRLGGVETMLIMIEQMEINDLCDGMNISFYGERQGVFTKDQLQQAIADVEACQ